MTSRLAMLLLMLLASDVASAQTPTCRLEQVVLQEAARVDGSFLTVSASAWSKSFSAGQKAFVRITNSSPPHVVGVRVRFYGRLASGAEKDDCIVQTLVLPGKPVVYSHSIFGGRPTYRVEVSLVNDVDVSAATVDLFALPPGDRR